VAAAVGLVLRVVSEVEQRVQSFVRFEPHVAADTAVAARRAAAGDEFFAPERRDAVAAVSSFYLDFCAVYKHFIILILVRESWISNCWTITRGRKRQKRRSDCSKRRL